MPSGFRTDSARSFIIANRNSDYFDQLDEKDTNQKKIKEVVKKRILDDLHYIGLDNIYGLKAIYDLHQIPIAIARLEMYAGISFQIAAVASAPIIPLAKAFDSAAGLFIAESICGLIFELFNGGEKFDQEQYFKNKGISYAISVGVAVLGGIFAIANQSQFVLKAKMACVQKLNKFFINPFLTKTLNFKVAIKLPSSVVVSTPRISGSAVSFSRSVLAKIKHGAISAGISLGVEKLMNPTIHKLLQGLRPLLEAKIKSTFDKEIEKKLLRTVSAQKIMNFSDQIIKEQNDNVTQKIGVGIAVGTLKGLHTRRWWVNITSSVLATLLENIVELPLILNFAIIYCGQLNRALHTQADKENNNINTVLSDLIKIVTDFLYELIVSRITALSQDLVIDPMIGRHLFKPESREHKKSGFISQPVVSGKPGKHEAFARSQRNLEKFNGLAPHSVSTDKLAGSGLPIVQPNRPISLPPQPVIREKRKPRPFSNHPTDKVSLTGHNSFFQSPEIINPVTSSQAGPSRDSNIPESRGSRTSDGSYGTRNNDRENLRRLGLGPVDNKTHQAEHPIGFQSLVLSADPDLDVHRRMFVGGQIERMAPSYYEHIDSHREHIGTGNRGTDGSGMSSTTYRESQNRALAEGSPGNAFQLNQIGYAHLPNFRDRATTSKGRIASISFFNMLRQYPSEVIFLNNDGSAGVARLTPQQRAEAHIARLTAERGHYLSRDEQIEIAAEYNVQFSP